MRRRNTSLWPLLLAVGTGCIKAPPPHPRALENNEYCAQYIGAGNLEKAEVHCDLGLSFSPEYSDLWVNKGLIALRRGQMELAKEDFNKALHYNQDQAQALNNLGFIYFKDHQLGRAHDMFEHALKVNPDYIEARYNLALTYKEMGEKAKARKEYRTILVVNPNIADAHADLGVIALGEGAYEEAIAELSKAAELSPQYAEAWLNLGIAYAESGKYQEAKDAFTSCLEADHDNVPCRNQVALVARKAQLLDPTLKEVRETQLAENTAPAMYQLGITYRERGLRAEEERAYRKCVKLDGRYAACHYGLFLIYKEDRRDQEAMIACKNFLKFAASDEFPSEVETCEKYVNSAAF